MIVRDLKIEVRLLGGLLAMALGGNMVIDALWIFSEHTVMSRIARLSTYPQALAYYWMLSALLITPYFLVQVLDIMKHHNRHITRLACWSVMAGGVLYAYMGFLSRNLDYQYVTESFVASSILNMAMATALAYTLNSSQRRAEDDAK